MKSINFDEGYKEYAINNDPSRVIKIRVADIGLLDRVKKASADMEKLFAKYKNAPDLDEMSAFDKEFRELLNTAFGSDICTPVFGNSSVMSLTSSGNYLFSEFMNAFLPVLEADIKAAVMTQKINAPEIRPEVKKYVDAPTVKPLAGLAKPYGEQLPDVSGLTAEQKKALLAQLLS